jgi:hypothetical protein
LELIIVNGSGPSGFNDEEALLLNARKYRAYPGSQHDQFWICSIHENNSKNAKLSRFPLICRTLFTSRLSVSDRGFSSISINYLMAWKKFALLDLWIWSKPFWACPKRGPKSQEAFALARCARLIGLERIPKFNKAQTGSIVCPLGKKPANSRLEALSELRLNSGYARDAMFALRNRPIMQTCAKIWIFLATGESCQPGVKSIPINCLMAWKKSALKHSQAFSCAFSEFVDCFNSISINYLNGLEKVRVEAFADF